MRCLDRCVVHLFPTTLLQMALYPKALEGLRTLAQNMHDHSGIENPLEEWMTSVLGQWKGFIMSIMVSLSVFIAIITTCECCFIPCLRALVVCLIDRAVASGPEGPGAMMLLLGGRASRPRRTGPCNPGLYVVSDLFKKRSKGEL